VKVYIAGPMSGIPAFNIPAFDEAARVLRDRGFDVVSPAEIDGPITRQVLLASPEGSHDDLPQEESWSYYLSRDFCILADDGIEAIVTLPGWEKSRGARLEVLMGKELGIPEISLYGILHLQDMNKEEPFVPYVENPERQRSVYGGVKDNKSKSRVDLIPAIALMEVGKIMAYGAQKYKPHNWRLGLNWSDTIASALRHIYAFSEGEDIDPETNQSHIAHAACQVLFLLTYVLTGTGTDDRYVSLDKEEAKA